MGNFRYAKYDSSSAKLGLDDPNKLVGSDLISLNENQVISAIGGTASRLSNIMGHTFYGSIAARSSSGSNFTYHTTTIVEQHFTRVRICFKNFNATETTYAQTKVAVSNAMGDDLSAARYTPSTATWVQVTFGGQNSVTLPPAITTTANIAEPSRTWSDWIDIASIARTDGGTLPVIMIRTYVASGNVYNNGAASIPNWQLAAQTAMHQGRMHTLYRYTGDGITTPSNFALTTDLGASSGPFHTDFEYAGVKPGFTFGIVGDSIDDGAVNGSVGNYGNGWVFQAMNLLRAAYPDIPIDYASVAFSSTKATSFVERMQRWIASGAHYDAIIYSVSTPNDTPPSQAFYDSHMKNWAQSAELVNRGQFVTLPTVVPTVGASPWVYIAPANGTVAIAGGTVSAVTWTRGTSTAVTVPTAGLVPVRQGDLVTITYTVTPTVTFVPSGAGIATGKPFVVRTPCPNTAAGWSEAQDAFRLAEIATMFEARDAGALVVDASSGLSDGAVPARFIAALTTDGTHPNEAGHAVIAEAAFPVLRRLLPASTFVDVV